MREANRGRADDGMREAQGMDITPSEDRKRIDSLNQVALTMTDSTEENMKRANLQ